MQLLRDLHELDEPCRGGSAITLGVFDGVHLGHQALMRRTVERARALGVRSLVFTFERHPLSVIAPVYCPASLAQPDQKAEFIAAQGIDLCLMLPFSREFAKTSAEDFIAQVLLGRCKARFVTCGTNFNFGAGGKGKPELLTGSGARDGFEVEVIDPLTDGPGIISSTRIRENLLQGGVADAGRLLGRPYAIRAEVVRGHQRGRTIGFPTANLSAPPDQLIPADGVYAVRVRVMDDGGNQQWHGGMLNAGRRPTFEGAGRAMEVHLFDFSGDLVGKRVEVAFAERVRDEVKFSGVDALIAQLKKDETACRSLLTTR